MSRLMGMSLSRLSSPETLHLPPSMPNAETAHAIEMPDTARRWENYRPCAQWEIQGMAANLRSLPGAEPRVSEWLGRQQEALLACMQEGEALAFRMEWCHEQDVKWGFQLLQQGGANAAGSTLAVDCVLSAQAGVMEVRKAASVAEDSAPCLWLRPILGQQRIEDGGLGFRCQEAGREECLLPKLVTRIAEARNHLPSLLGQADGLLHLEIWVRPSQDQVIPWKAAPLGRLEDRKLARQLEQRLDALAQVTGWEVVCRVRLESETAGWGSLLGRLLWGCEARLAAEPPTPEESAACAMPSVEMPLLMPNSDQMMIPGRAPMAGKPPIGLPKTGVLIGQCGDRKVRLSESGRQRHTYLVGGTGTGKSTLLANLICQDIAAGEGVVVIDPHGELLREVKDAIPAHREHEVTMISPRSPRTAAGFNMLSKGNQRLSDLEAGFIIGELYSLVECLFDLRSTGGPMFEMYFRNALKLMTKADIPERPTLMDMDRVFVEPNYRAFLLNHCDDEILNRFWQKQATQVKGDCSLDNMTPYIVSKLDGLRSSGFLRGLLCAGRPKLDLGRLMNRRGILLVDASKGLLGMTECRLLGICLLIRLFSCSLGRTNQQRSIPVRLYVDEFQNFVTDSMAGMLSEARKFGLCLTLANQTLAQLESNAGRENILASILGNVGNLIAFRLGVQDSDRLAPFTDPLTNQDVQRMPNFHAFARVLTETGPLTPLVVKTLPIGAFGSQCLNSK